MNAIRFIYTKKNWFGRMRELVVERTLPSSWAEVDASFFRLFSNYFFSRADADGFVLKWADLPKRMSALVKNYIVTAITDLLAKLFERPCSNEVFIKRIEIQKTIMWGVDGSMSDMCFAQFADADSFVRAYAKQKDDKYLRGLAAVLYRQDYKQKYDSRHVPARAELLMHIDQDVLKAVYLNFICFLNWLSDAYPSLYLKDISPDGKIIPVIEEKQADPNYVELAYKLAGPKLGTTEQIEQMAVGYVFWLLCRKD